MVSEKRLNSREILVVEDSPTQAVPLQFLLEEQGYEVIAARNGQEGLAAARQHKPDLIISDIIMPVMNGYDMCHAIKQDEALQDIPVILLTVLSDTGDIVRGLKAGTDYYVTKPYDEDHLLSTVEFALAAPVRQKGEGAEEGLEVTFAGEHHVITSDRRQILNLLLSTYGNAVQQNRQLAETQRELEKLNEQLEEKVLERTAALQAEIIWRKRAEETLRESEEKLKEAQALGRIGNWEFDIDNQKVDWSDETYRLYERDPAFGPPTVEEEAAYYAPEQAERLREYARRAIEEGKEFKYDLQAKLSSGKLVHFSATMHPVKDESGRIGKLFGTVQDITERKRSEEEVQRHLQRIEALQEIDRAIMSTLDLTGVLDIILKELERVIPYHSAGIFLLSGGVARLTVGRGFPDMERALQVSFPVNDDPLTCQLLRDERPLVLADAQADARFLARTDTGYVRSWIGVPLIARDRAVGFLTIDHREPGVYGEENAEMAQAFAGQVAIAIDNARLYEQTQQRLQRLTALRTIDMAITASLDLRVTLNVILDQITAQLGVDAADVLLLNPHTQKLEYATGRGFRSRALRHTSLRLGEGYAGRAALERRIVSIPNLEEAENGLRRAPLLPNEGFVCYYAVPLIAKGQVKGVLETFHRASLDPGPEWLDFLDTLAGQAAIAIDNVTLFDGLQRSNLELTLSYDTTLEGWAHALELRDMETEGHSRNVTEMTLRLARAMGMSEAELVHMRRGALLHDIGKMGIPDSILLKPGPLTDEEWEIMRQHPVYAYQLLSPIPYLRPSLDIPYCHHEKWDGTGYPRGLKGEQIPLAARIFALVDVWDALRSDRPYRKAWPEEGVREYIQEQAGMHFDPQVVEVFLELVGEDEGTS